MRIMPFRSADLTGRRFGLLLVIGPARTAEGRCCWLCRCDCGADKLYKTNELVGCRRSCGCGVRNAVVSRNYRHNPNALPRGVAAFNDLLRTYKGRAYDRSLPWELTDQQARNLFTAACHYCGVPPKQVWNKGRNRGSFVYNGIDRLDNGDGYWPDNCVACCGMCNRAKGAMPVDQFVRWLDTVASFRQPARAEAM